MENFSNIEHIFFRAIEWRVGHLGRGAQSTIVKDTGIAPSYLSRIVSGEKPGTEDVRRAISASLGYEYEEMLSLGQWIIDGNDGNDWTPPATSPEADSHTSAPDTPDTVNITVPMGPDEVEVFYALKAFEIIEWLVCEKKESRLAGLIETIRLDSHFCAWAEKKREK